MWVGGGGKVSTIQREKERERANACMNRDCIPLTTLVHVLCMGGYNMMM